MMSNLNPAFAYMVVYVRDVTKSVAFYSKAFGYNVRRLHESHRWGELDSGQTTIAFTPIHQHETEGRTGVVQTPGSGQERPLVEVCFAYKDVDSAYKRAVESGAVPVSEPEDKEWGQKVGYICASTGSSSGWATTCTHRSTTPRNRTEHRTEHFNFTL